MPRTRRLLLSKSFYHIMARGNNHNVIFKNKKNYQYYLENILKYKSEHPFDLYHYCLMPNHIHFLIQTKNALDFSTFMKKINLAYFHHFKQEYGWVGHLWQGRYKSQPVGKDEYFIQCGKYIELNPVRANLVKTPKNYKYSSYNFYAYGKPNELITKDFMFNNMGKNDIERQKVYRDLIIDEIIEGSYRKSAWGSNQQKYRESDKINRKLKKV